MKGGPGGPIPIGPPPMKGGGGIGPPMGLWGLVCVARWTLTVRPPISLCEPQGGGGVTDVEKREAHHGVMQSVSGRGGLFESDKSEAPMELRKRTRGKERSLALAGASLGWDDTLLDLAVFGEDGPQLLHRGVVIQAADEELPSETGRQRVSDG
jgi:hypothetical protein